jgi:flagellar biosynthetic protein FlhB
VAEESFMEKTEQATPKRREDARKKGQVAKSIEVNSALLLLFGVIILNFAGLFLYSRIGYLITDIIGNIHTIVITQDTVWQLFLSIFIRVAIVLFPIMVLLMSIGMLASYSQVGFLFTVEPMTPNFDKLNPLKGIKKVIFSKRAFVELMKGLLKITIIGLIGWSTIKSYLDDSIFLMDSDIISIFLFLCRASVNIALKITLVFLLFSGVDYFLQRRLYENEIKMTKDEIKQENKQLEGDPLVKSRIRSIQRQMARRRMMQEVPKADVVITNPTHYAVALKYDANTMAAPKLLAKGADAIAQKIKEIAIEHDIPIVEDKPLAQLIYKTVEINDDIPQEMYQAVAQILAYIYKVKKKKITVN